MSRATNFGLQFRSGRPALAGLLIAIALLLAPIGLFAHSDEDEDYSGKKILLVDAYHAGYAWSDDIVEAALANLEAVGIDVLVVHMDTKNNIDEDFREDAAETVMEQVEEFAPDLIIAAEDNAQRYLVVPYLMETDIPVVFVGVNWSADEYGYPATNVTGILEVELVDQVVNLMSQYARGNRLGYLAVRTDTEEKSLEIMQERFFSEDIEVYLVDTFEEYAAAFIEAQDTVDMLFLGNNAGIDRWNADEAQALFLEHSTIPTGGTREWTAPYALITLAKDASEQGEWAAEAAMDIFSGMPITDIPITENRRGNLILNLDIADVLGVIFSPFELRNAEIYTASEDE